MKGFQKIKAPEVPQSACRTLVLLLGKFRLADRAEAIPFYERNEEPGLCTAIGKAEEASFVHLH